LSHLRFTPAQYRAVCQLCRPLELDDDFFPDFKAFLVQALLGDLPELAQRIALLGPDQLRLLFHHVRSRKAVVKDCFTPEDFRALCRACHAAVRPHRFLHYYKETLTRHFQKTRPSLARKLERLSDEQFRELYERVRGRKRKG
jgi:hypothetical protein